MHLLALRAAATVTLAATAAAAQTTTPLPPIDSTTGLATVGIAEFASLPDLNGIAARMMHLQDEPGTRRLFVNDMRGPIYAVSYDGRTVSLYLDTNDSTWGQVVQSQGRERGIQGFAFHPQFAQAGAPGFGKFYTWVDLRDNQRPTDFKPAGGSNTHHTALLEWSAKTPTATTYDGGPPRELFRLEQPFANHNGGMIAFNPLARPGDADYGLLYVGIGDGGSGGDPQNLAQNVASAFGKIFRINPTGRGSANGKYGIPATNPYAGGRNPGALPEIFAIGLRNPQRFAWDPANGTMYVSDIGQNIVEEISTATAGANLGWNAWEGSFRYAGRGGVIVEGPRADSTMVFPVVEYQHADPLFQRQVAVAGLHVVRGDAIPALRNKVLFADNPSGELFWFDADNPPRGGSTGIHRVLFRTPTGETKNLLGLVREKNAAQGKPPATRVDLRFSGGSDGRIFLLNKADGTIRVLMP